MSDREPCWVLSAVGGPADGREFLVVGDTVYIGRAPDSDICIRDPNVSRKHAGITVRDDTVWIRDCGSKNGVLVNDEKIKDEIPLREGDFISIGGHGFRIDQSGGNDPLAHIEGTSRPSKEPGPSQGTAQSSRRRIFLYGAALIIIAYAVFSNNARQKNDSQPTASTPTRTLFIGPVEVPDHVADEQILSWQSRAETALAYQDWISAIPLLSKLVASRPEQPRYAALLERARTHLAELLTHYYENGAREFEKLHFDRAIQEWQKVLALAAGLDPELTAETNRRIFEARARLTSRSR